MMPTWARGRTPLTSKFLSRLHRSVNDLCADYLTDLKQGRILPAPKIVQDSLWGFIRISAPELVLIDSPLIQRLRYIRQLGFAFQLFPNAGYSRFEHSIGVCHIVGDFAKALKEAGGTISEQQTQILRLAAILHDVGHLAFSHVSERGLRHFRPLQKCIEEIRSAISEAMPDLRKEPSTSEIISVCICISPAVTELLEFAIQKGLGLDLAVLQKAICEYILGATGNSQHWFLAELISSSMDADKMDYIPRDCMVTGVPLPFDVRRLILKTRITAADVGTRLGVSFTGARALHDLTVSRSMLREKIYRHPKVMAAEAMFDNAMALAAEVAPNGINGKNLLDFDDGNVWEILRSLCEGSGRALAEIKTTAKHIQHRRLIKRAFVFSSQFFAEAETTLSPQGAKLATLMANEDRVVQLRRKAFAELKKILRVMGRANETPVSHRSLAIAQADLKSGAGAEQHGPWIVDDDGNIVQHRPGWQHFLSSTDWAVAHEAGGALNYVFGPENLRTETHIAVRNVLARDYKLVFMQPAALLAKVSPKRVLELDKQILAKLHGAAKNEYRDTLLLCCRAQSKEITEEFLAAMELQVSSGTRLLMQNHESQVNEMLQRVAVFDGAGGHRMSRSRLEAWLSQFEDEVQKDALKLFLNLVFLDRSKFVATVRTAVTELLKKMPACKSIFIAPLTTSGDILKYYSGDAVIGNVRLQTFPSVSEAAATAAVTAGSALLVVDDVLGSGVQCEDVVRIWFGEPPKHELSTIASRLSKEAETFMTSGQCVAFAWAFGLAEGRDRVSIVLKERRIEALFVYGEVGSIDLGVFGSRSPIAFDNPEQLKIQCQTYGEELLEERARKRKWSTAHRKQRALGYGGASQLVVTPYNCPTVTLPVLWCAGRVNSKPWIPLFCRRFRS